MMPELSALRRVCSVYKQQVCEVAHSLHASKRADILRCVAAFPGVTDVQLVEVDFGTWAEHCARRFAVRAAPHIAWFRSVSERAECVREHRREQTLLISRLLECSPADFGDAHETAMRSFNWSDLIVRLTAADADNGLNEKGRPLAEEATSRLLDWCGEDAALLDGRRGIFHAPLESVVEWWAARGRMIDMGAAFLYLRFFKRVFGIGTGPGKLEDALRARSEISALWDFLRRSIAVEPAEGLLRAIRRQFGAQRTSSLQVLLREVFFRVTERHLPRERTGKFTGCVPGIGYYVPGLFMALMAYFEEMVREIVQLDMTDETRGIVKRKWVAILSCVGAHNRNKSTPAGAELGRLRRVVDATFI